MSRGLRLAVLGVVIALGLAWGQGAAGTLNGTILGVCPSIGDSVTENDFVAVFAV